MCAVLTIGLLLISPAWAQSGGNYKLKGATITSGGGISTGVSYSLSSSVAIPEAGEPITGGHYAECSGFLPEPPPPFVDMPFLAAFADQWLMQGTDLAADFNGDEKVDLLDYSMMASYWLCYSPKNWL